MLKILIVGGTRYFGIPMTKRLIARGHEVTIATRGITSDSFGLSVSRIILDRTDEASICTSLAGAKYDVIIDKIAYSSDDVRRLTDNVTCGRYILMSSSAVYENVHANTDEEAFNPSEHQLKWGERADFDYAEGKRQAECALFQNYHNHNRIAVRYPVVLGENDYTGRLRFYADHIINGIPMHIDDMDSRISFIHEYEAALFLAHLVEADVTGAINGCSGGSISIAEIIRYIEENSGCRAVLSEDGDEAPFNGYPQQATLNTDKAARCGFIFGTIDSWIYRLLDDNINAVKK